MALEVEGSIPFAHPINTKKEMQCISFFVFRVREGDIHNPPRLAVARRWIDRPPGRVELQAACGLCWVRSPSSSTINTFFGGILFRRCYAPLFLFIGSRRGCSKPATPCKARQWIDRPPGRVDSNACVALGSIPLYQYCEVKPRVFSMGFARGMFKTRHALQSKAVDRPPVRARRITSRLGLVLGSIPFVCDLQYISRESSPIRCIASPFLCFGFAQGIFTTRHALRQQGGGSTARQGASNYKPLAACVGFDPLRLRPSTRFLGEFFSGGAMHLCFYLSVRTGDVHNPPRLAKQGGGSTALAKRFFIIPATNMFICPGDDPIHASDRRHRFQIDRNPARVAFYRRTVSRIYPHPLF